MFGSPLTVSLQLSAGGGVGEGGVGGGDEFSTDWSISASNSTTIWTMPSDCYHSIRRHDPAADYCKTFNFAFNGVLIGSLCLAGLVGNLVSLMVLQRDRCNRVAGFLLQALAVADCAVLVISLLACTLFLGIIPYFSASDRIVRTLRPYMVKFVQPLAYMSQTATIWTTVLLSINRYIGICKPFDAPVWCSIQKAMAQVIAVAVFAIGFNLPRFFPVPAAPELLRPYHSCVHVHRREQKVRDRLHKCAVFGPGPAVASGRPACPEHPGNRRTACVQEPAPHTGPGPEQHRELISLQGRVEYNCGNVDYYRGVSYLSHPGQDHTAHEELQRTARMQLGFLLPGQCLQPVDHFQFFLQFPDLLRISEEVPEHPPAAAVRTRQAPAEREPDRGVTVLRSVNTRHQGSSTLSVQCRLNSQQKRQNKPKILLLLSSLLPPPMLLLLIQ